MRNFCTNKDRSPISKSIVIKGQFSDNIHERAQSMFPLCEQEYDKKLFTNFLIIEPDHESIKKLRKEEYVKSKMSFQFHKITAKKAL